MNSNVKIHHQILPSETGFSFEIETPDDSIENPDKFIRILNKNPGQGSIVDFHLTFCNPIQADSALLHTDILGGEWKLLAFLPSADRQNSYSLSLLMPAGGYFSFRFLLEITDTGGITQLWEPSEYHRLIIDPPVVENLRMVTLLPTVSGKIPDWTVALDHIHRMGFNGVHILPFTAMGPSESPYSAVDHFSIDDHYLHHSGDFTAFQKFVNRAEELGMSLCFDIVLNHVSDQSLIVKEHGNWVIPDPDEPDGLKRAGCWHEGNWISWEDLVLIDYEHPDPDVLKEIYQYMLKVVLFWIGKAENCEVLIRLDNLHSSNERFIKWLLSEIRKAAPRVPVLGEFFGSREALAEGVRAFGLNMLTANTWELPFVPMLTEYLKYIHEDGNPVRYYLAPTSHDTETATELFATPLSAIPRYFCCALMGTGQTGIVQGFEYGWQEKINFIGRQGLRNFRGDSDFTDIIGEINNLLASEKAFLQKEMEFIDTGDDSLLLAIRKGGENGKTFLLGASFNTIEERVFTYPNCSAFTTLLKHRASVDIDDSGAPVINFGSCSICVLQIQ